MKKFFASIVAAGMLFCAQSAIAESGNGTISMKGFSDEQSAVQAAKTTMADIAKGTNSVARDSAVGNCWDWPVAKYDATTFKVSPVWVENGTGVVKEFVAEVAYSFSCTFSSLSLGTEITLDF
ncbi:MAG: hypothetical protein GY866_41320 [Proteobacteria bacterium]|nr:hypothetical protein [Pseudomonadota bacterium]